MKLYVQSIKIDPLDKNAIGPSSIDLTLGNTFRQYKMGRGIVRVTVDTDYKDLTEVVHVEDGEEYILPPGQTCLGITKETIQLSGNLCGLLEGRSRIARLGLFVHITAGFMQPGIQNAQVLEIYNASPNCLALVPGTKICQFVFMEMKGEAFYQGKFAHQSLEDENNHRTSSDDHQENNGSVEKEETNPDN